MTSTNQRCGAKSPCRVFLPLVFCFSFLFFIFPQAAHSLDTSPFQFTAQALSTSSIQWSWSTGTVTAVDGYRIYSSTTGSSYIAITQNTSYYIDSNLAPNKQYTRWIQINPSGTASDQVSRYSYAIPPATIHVCTVTATSALVYWRYNSATAYVVECSTDSGLTYAYNRETFVPPQTITLLSNSTYWIRMGARNGEGIQTPGLYSAVFVTTTPPPTPELFYGVAISSCAIQWQWDNTAFQGTGITGYAIYKSTISTDGELPAITDILGEKVTDISGMNTTYWVETYADGAAASANSRHTRGIRAVGKLESQGRTITRKYTYAVAPSTCYLKSPDFENIDETLLNMEYPASGATKYIIEYSTMANFSLSMTSVAVTGVSPTLSNLTSNTKYDIRIGAVNGDDEQTPDNSLNPFAYGPYVDNPSAYTFRILTRAPPPDVTVSAYSDTAIKWSWSTGTYTNLDYISGYGIGELVYLPAFQKEVVVTYYTILGKDTSEYIQDYLLTNSTHTRYIGAEQVCAGYDCYGSLVPGRQGCTFATPPNDLDFSTITTRTIGFWWKEPDVPATQYRIERSATIGEAGPWVFVSSVTGNTYNDAGLEPSTTYSYKIGAINRLGIQTLGLAGVTNGNRRDYSFVATTTTLHRSPLLYATALSTGSIMWHWTNDVAEVTLFHIYNSTDGIIQSNIASNATYWVESNLAGANTAFTRRIKSETVRGLSDYNEYTCYTLAVPPSNLAVTTATLHSISLEWQGNGCSRFSIARSADQNAWSALTSTASAYQLTTYTDRALRLSTTYYYAVTGFNGDGVPTLSSATCVQKTSDLPANITLLISSAAAAQQQLITLPGFGVATIDIPVAALPSDGYIFANTNAFAVPIGVSKTDIDGTVDKLLPHKLVDGTVLELFYYDIYGSTVAAAFTSPLRLTISYPDANSDGILDTAAATKAESLKIYLLDEAQMAWVEMSTSHLDKVNRLVYADLAHFSIYSLVSYNAMKNNLTNVVVYPNPYKPGSGGIFDNSQFGEGIVFNSLTSKAQVRIYNIAGELVADFLESDGDGRYIWDCRNTDGSKVASGLYFYIVTNPDVSGDTCTGRITIIK